MRNAEDAFAVRSFVISEIRRRASAADRAATVGSVERPPAIEPPCGPDRARCDTSCPLHPGGLMAKKRSRKPPPDVPPPAIQDEHRETVVKEAAARQDNLRKR